MATLSHGSDLRLAPTLGPVAHSLGCSARRALTTLAGQGFTAVQLDATMPGLRPRELDRSARRDLLATASRTGLTIAGLDFFIPAEHFSDPNQMDRAADAAVAACTLASDLGRVPLSINLPIGKAPDAMVSLLLEAVDRTGVCLAIHDEADANALKRWLIDQDSALLGAGLDPAGLLIRGNAPAEVAQSLGAVLRVARLSDASKGQADGGRRSIGTGSLDVMAYRVAIDLAPSRIGPVVLDLRSLSSPLAEAQSASTAWEKASIRL